MSAPLPCWTSTSPIIATAAAICSSSTIFIITCIEKTPRKTAEARPVRGYQPAARAMATKSAAFSAAPPIRPPSMSAWEKRIAALSGLTLPP